VGEKQQRTQKTALIVCIVVPVASLHFLTGDNYGGPYPEFVNCYLLDILLPLSFYFLLCLIQSSLLRSWIVRALLVFSAAACVEVAQFFGIPLLGRTFDPIDIVMYALGVGLAVILDTLVFPRILSFWGPESNSSSRAPAPG